jgi:hypothetical protein
MSLKHLALGLAIAATMPTGFETAQAADGLYVPLFTYRTGPFAGSGTPYANGLTDYLTMLNERDGGIGGIKLIIEECETTLYLARQEPHGRHLPTPDADQELGGGGYFARSICL